MILFIVCFSIVLIRPAWNATYSISPLLHSSAVEEKLREFRIAPPGGTVLFGEVVIKNDSADVAWVAAAPDILVLGLNDQIGVEGPGAVGRVFGPTARTAFLRLIDFGEQGLIVNEAGRINATWHCPHVTATNRACPTKDPQTQGYLDRLLAVADRGRAYEEFDGLEFGGRVLTREHLLPTQINKFGQVVFIHPLGQSPNGLFLATPVSLGALPGPSLALGARPDRRSRPFPIDAQQRPAAALSVAP